MTASVSSLEPLVPATQQAASGEMLAPLDADTGAGFSLAEVVRVSFDSLIANKTRSFLTMLGVIIGVASVVALLSLGNGAQASITGQVQSIGTNLIFVMPGSVNTRRPGAMSAAQNLTMEDVQAISGLGLPLNGIAPQFSGNADIVAPAADKNATIIGTTPAYFALQDLRPTSGSLFDEGQSRAAAPVAVLGATLAKDLFGNGTAVGQTVRVKDQTLRVVGVLAAKGGGGMGARPTISSSRRSASCNSACSGRARRMATATEWQTSCSRRATATTSKPSRIGSRSCSASAII